MRQVAFLESLGQGSVAGQWVRQGSGIRVPSGKILYLHEATGEARVTWVILGCSRWVRVGRGQGKLRVVIRSPF